MPTVDTNRTKEQYFAMSYNFSTFAAAFWNAGVHARNGKLSYKLQDYKSII